MTAVAPAWQILDCRVAVDGLNQVLSARVRELYACFPLAEPEEADLVILVEPRGDGWQLTSPEGNSVRGDDPQDLLLAIGTAVNAAVLSRTRHLSVHAGVVGLEGSAIVFPAPSGAGKSTLTLACLSQGMSYLSDEALCLSAPNPLAVPYPKPLTLSRASRALLGIDNMECAGTRPPPGLRKEILSPVESGADASPIGEPLPVRHVVLPARAPGETRLEELPPSAAVPELLRHAFNAFANAPKAVETVVNVARNASCWRLHYDDARLAAALLSRTLPVSQARQAS